MRHPPKNLAVPLVGASLVAALLLGLALMLGLPLLAALERPHPAPPLWLLIAPLVGLGACLLQLTRFPGASRRQRPPSAARLALRCALPFTVAALIPLVAGGLVAQDAITRQRPLAVLLCGPALTLAVGLLLLVTLQRLLRRVGPAGAGPPDASASSSEPAAHPLSPSTWRGAVPRSRFAIRSSITATAATLAAMALALVVGHASSLLARQEQQQVDRLLRDGLKLAEQGRRQWGSERLARLLRQAPPSPTAVVVLLDRQRRVRTPRPELPAGVRLAAAGAGRCLVNARLHRCQLSADHRLAAISTTAAHGALSDPLQEMGSTVALVALVVLLMAMLVGWSVGHDTSADLNATVAQLDEMATAAGPELSRPVSVKSIDEIGDLTQALGQLRKQLEREIATHRAALRGAVEAEQAKNAFFSSVSHELRTPLTTICGYAQLLLDGAEGPLDEEQRADVASILQGGQQLLALVNDVLDISVIESGHLQLHPEPTDIVALCRDAVRAQRAALEAQGRAKALEVRLEAPDRLPQLRADPHRLTQALNNLLTNAVKFTRKGSVTVRLRPLADEAHAGQQPRAIVLEVEDTGVGISALDLPQIFMTYRQVGELTARRQGSGLGLAITKHLVERHGGTIDVRSAVGEGTTFQVTLPVQGSQP